jgi:tRNA-splicing ligase RtcB
MLNKKDFIKINDYLWEIPRTFRQDMRVPARAYLTEKMLEESFKDRSLEQLINICTLPGIQKYALAMPDMHEGYASPIGGVAAIRISDGIVSPGMCGYDINCGMKLLKSEYSQEQIQPYL